MYIKSREINSSHDGFSKQKPTSLKNLQWFGLQSSGLFAQKAIFEFELSV